MMTDILIAIYRSDYEGVKQNNIQKAECLVHNRNSTYYNSLLSPTFIPKYLVLYWL